MEQTNRAEFGRSQEALQKHNFAQIAVMKRWRATSCRGLSSIEAGDKWDTEGYAQRFEEYVIKNGVPEDLSESSVDSVLESIRPLH